MTRSLDDLSQGMKPIVFELLARITEASIPVKIIDILRTPEQHAINLANGTSWTSHSKHLPDENGKSNAIDICPYYLYNLKGPNKLQWDAGEPIWKEIGLIGESLGLTWGGRWIVRDMGHFELKEP